MTLRSRFTPLALLLAAGALLLAACGSDKAPAVLSGLQSDPPLNVSELSLPEASNGDAPFTFEAQPGGLLIVYFGYTQCPDVCPTTLSEVKKALKKAGDDIASKTQVAMITVDPNRDTADLLTRYVQSFVEGSHALRTEDDAALQAVAKGFGTSYTVTTKDDGTVDVVHDGKLFVIDQNGDMVLQWFYGIKSDAIATDLRLLFQKG